MRDRRSVDDLSIEELERILAIKKRQAREERMRRYERSGRRVSVPGADDPLEIEGSFYNDNGPGSEAEETAESPPREKTLRDRLLLGVEFAAVVGLVVLLVAAAFSLRDLNRETAEALALDPLPTPSATPLIGAVVLPGGHTPPTDPGGAQPNYAEVPDNLRPLVEQAYFSQVAIPTPGPDNPTRITVPAIGIDAPVVEGDGWEQLQKGVGRHLGTANPGQAGNMVLSAHNDIFGEIFRDLDRLSEGDEIFVQTTTRSYTYVVRDTRIVDPTEVSVMNPTREPTTTLISCYPYLVDSERIVVVAELVGS
jgi:sortase A